MPRTDGRHCSGCNTFKPWNEFHKTKSSATGHVSRCKPCVKIKRREHFLANKEKTHKQNKEWYWANKAKRNAKSNEWYRNNKEVVLANCAKRRLKKLERSFFKDKFESEIKEIYAEAKRISEQTGILHHVDHMCPLQGRRVSGLHVPWNLRIIPASENLAKKNKFIEALARPAFTDLK